MRFLHTADWHLGKPIRGVSRQPEFELVLQEVVGIARQERVDAVLIAGDVYDTFAPSTEAERLFYETMTQLLTDGAKVVVIAGNHDHALRMDALAGLLRMAGVYCLGALPLELTDAVLQVPSRDRAEAATIVALPWVPERYALQFEVLMEELGKAVSQYADALAGVLTRLAQRFAGDTVNLLLGHLLIDGAEIGPDGGERKLHIGQNFAVSAQALPPTAHYAALGHVHRSQRIAAALPVYYAGSLLQLDFGDEGQSKGVRIIDARPGRPAQVQEIPLRSGRRLRAVQLEYRELEAHRGCYGDDYLKVAVALEHPQPNLFEQVREVLPNAVDVSPRYPQAAVATAPELSRRGLAPHELFARYYQDEYQSEVPAELLQLFNELQAKESHATA